MKCSFANNAFICRLCGARGRSKADNDFDIQNLEYHHPMLKEPTAEILDSLEVQHEFVFSVLPGINIFNCCPLDLLHDLAEGIIPDVLKYVFHCWDRDAKISADVIIDRINSFGFNEGKPTLSTWTKRVKGQGAFQMFRFESSAIQV